MDMYEFGKVCQPLNKKYNELFGYIPHHDDFPCTREEYVDALCSGFFLFCRNYSDSCEVWNPKNRF